MTDKPEWQRLARRLRRQLIAELRSHPQFDWVGKDMALVGPLDAARGAIAIIDGRITSLDSGHDLVAAVSGHLGWGGAELTAEFRIRDRDDRLAAAFSQTVSASTPLAEATVIGTVFPPHFQPLYGDELADALATEVADTIVAWAARGSR